MKLPFMRNYSPTYIFGVIGIIILLVNDFITAYQSNYDNYLPDQQETESLPTDKRYAMLSYSFRPRSRYGSRRRYRPYRKHYRYIYKYSNNYSQNRDKPWMKLPNMWCFRRPCSTTNDCCRKHNICDPSAKRCIDCWYGYPCTRNADCCERFPVCDNRSNSCKN
ncbi:uncharacterized protein LOC134705034 isoform X1 [Mytilus trossulus]|uniref:uncharacterized protein LOC134705034 isoform X1 n=1 Tax=Mytilus trossulus TaxID=6551 RepID=UPI003005F2E5